MQQQTDIVDVTRKPACKNKGCQVSIDVFKNVFTFGWGKLNQFGEWQYRCGICEAAYMKSLSKER